MHVVIEREVNLAAGEHVRLDAFRSDAEPDRLRLTFRSEGERAVSVLEGDEPARLAEMLAAALARQRPSPEPSRPTLWTGQLWLEGWPEVRFALDGHELIARMETSVEPSRALDGVGFELSGKVGYRTFVPHDEVKLLLDLIRRAVKSPPTGDFPRAAS